MLLLFWINCKLSLKLVGKYVIRKKSNLLNLIYFCFNSRSHRPLWKGVTTSGKTGLFDPSNVVAYLGSDLPSSSFLRNDSTRTSARRKLRSEMISAPQGDVKHTGHVGLDGAYFGDLSFLGGAKVNLFLFVFRT